MGSNADEYPPKRPKLLTPLEESLLNIGREKVTVRDGERTRQITKVDAVFRKTFETATKGSTHAQRHFLDRQKEAEEKQQALIEDDISFWGHYVDHANRLLRKARAEGKTEPELLPYPDDIAINRRKGVAINGPLNRKELNAFRQCCAIRDALIYQDALQKFQDKRRKDPSIEIGDAIWQAILINNLLPTRFQISSSDFIDRRIRYANIPGRELLKVTREAWSSCTPGDVRRGARLPEPAQMRVVMDEVTRIFREWHSGGQDPNAISETVDDGIARIAQRLGIDKV